MAGTFWTQAENQKRLNYISTSLTLGHAEILDGVKKCQQCVFVPCAYQPVSQWFVTTKSCDMMIPHMVWPTYLSRSDGWIPSQYPTYPAIDVPASVPHSRTRPNFFFPPRAFKQRKAAIRSCDLWQTSCTISCPLACLHCRTQNVDAT